MATPIPTGTMYELMMAAADNYGSNVCNCTAKPAKETDRKFDNVWADWRR